jgi:DNA repair protein RecO (recombination protein O)
MKNYISEAIIMRIKEYGETDLLVTFFTPQKGLLRGVAKGARRSRKRFVNALDILSLVKLEYGLKREGALYFLQSGKLINGYPGLRADYSNLSKASYMIELTEVLFPAGVADQRMFELLKGAFLLMNEGESVAHIPMIFEVKAMALGGFGIHFEKCCRCGRAYSFEGNALFIPETGGIACLKCHRESTRSPLMGPETVRVLKEIQSESLTESKERRWTDKEIQEIKPVLRLHREYHLERRLKTSKYVE